MEWELQELNKETKKVEENTIVENEETFGMAGAGVKKEKYSYEISTDLLPTEIIKLSIEIEKTLRTIYEIHFQTEQNRPVAISKLINKLNEEKVINNDAFNLLKTFWEMRNKIIHDHNITFSDRDYMSFVDIGIRILKVLKTIQFNKMDGKLPYYGIG